MTKPANIPVDANKEAEAAFMRAFYWRVAKTVLIVLLSFGLLAGVTWGAPFALESLGGGLIALLVLKFGLAFAQCWLLAVILQAAWPTSRRVLTIMCLMLGPIAFSFVLGRQTRAAGLEWLDEAVSFLAFAAIVVVAFALRSRRSHSPERKEPKTP